MDEITAARLNLLKLCVRVVEDKYGKQSSHEELTKNLYTEFPEEEFTLSEVLDYDFLSMQTEDNSLMMGNIGYDHQGS